MQTRKRLTGLTISEISAVTHPANEHALARIMKSASPTPLAFDSLDAAVDHLVQAGASRLDAYRKAAIAHPALLAKFNADLPTAPTPVAKSAASIAAQQLDIAAEGIRAKSPGMSRVAAYSAARRENPKLYDAMQS